MVPRRRRRRKYRRLNEDKDRRLIEDKDLMENLACINWMNWFYDWRYLSYVMHVTATHLSGYNRAQTFYIGRMTIEDFSA
jgi:hypothetical protein